MERRIYRDQAGQHSDDEETDGSDVLHGLKLLRTMKSVQAPHSISAIRVPSQVATDPGSRIGDALNRESGT